MPSAAQVVYTNVEEDRSPHRRRGFQLWLWTDGLSQPVLDEVEQRVNTFARLTPKEAEGLRDTPRRISAPLASGEFVLLAEAVPLSKPDKFGRGGRFHAHALLVHRDEFAGADPFSVFDAGFAFQRDPDQADWRTRHLPAVEVAPVTPTVVAVPDKLRPLVPELVAWLLADDAGKVVALPVGVADAEAVARAVVRLLPTEARRRFGFDTLWTGRGKYPPTLCGAGGPALLQAWPFRQFVRLDPDRRPGTPPLPAAAVNKALAAWWAATPELTDADRECGRALTAWANGKAELPEHPTPAAVTWAADLPGLNERFTQAVSDGIREAFPEAVRGLPGVSDKAADYFGGWGVEALQKLRTGILTAEKVRWVSEIVLADPSPRLDEDVARAIIDWRGKDKSGEAQTLRLAAGRWLPEYREFVCGQVRGRTAEDDWFRNYCWATLPPDLKAEGAAGRVVDGIARYGGTLPDDAELYEALYTGTDEDNDELDRLRLLLRFQDRLGGRPDEFLRRKPGLFTWAADFVLPRVAGECRAVALDEPHSAEPRYWGRFFEGENHPLALLGVRLPPAGGADGGGLLAYFAATLRADFLPRFDPRFDPRTFPRLVTEPTGVEKQPGWAEVQAAFRKKSEGKLAEALGKATDATYRKLANDSLFPRVKGWLACGELWDDGGFFVGAAVALSDEQNKELTVPLLRALVGGAVPFARAGAEELPAADERFLHRFGWLVVRLLNPSTTELLGVSE